MPLEQMVEAHHVLMFGDNVQQVAQQKKARIRPGVTETPASGEAKSASDLVGKIRATRASLDERRNTQNRGLNARRWLVLPDEIKSGDYISRSDTLQSAMDPTSKYVQQHTMAVIREIDDVCLGTIYNGEQYVVGTGGILGRAVEGKNPGGTTVALPSDCFTPAGGTGLTLQKLKDSRQRLKEDEFGLDDDEEIWCAISPQQENDLLALADGDGSSLNAFQQLQLQNGKPTQLLGYNWVVTNSLPVNAAGERMCPIWTKSNIVAGIWQDIKGAMWNDTSADYTPYVKVSAIIDAVRVQDRGVHVIECAE